MFYCRITYYAMTHDTYTLHQLAARTGIEPRTIRSYIQLGLLPGPEGAGRGAHYLSLHLERLQAILVLKDVDGLSLADIRRRFLATTTEEIGAIVARAPASGGRGESSIESRTTPLAFVRELRQKLGEEGVKPSTAAESASADGVFAEAFRSPAAFEPSPRRVASMSMSYLADATDVRHPVTPQDWLRFPVTPDVEVHVRSPIEQGRRAQVEKLVARFRRMIVGGDDDGSR
jgi:DNA-binding transcriptional MerR regulator